MATYLNNGLQDIFTLGPPAQAYAPRPRAIEVAYPDTGVLVLSLSGLFAESRLRFTVEGSATPGHPSAVLPEGLSPSLMYQALPVDDSLDLFRVQPVGGSPITSFGDAGDGVFSIVVDVGATLMAIAANESDNINERLTAQRPPILPDPDTGLYAGILVGVTARRTAVRGALNLGLANPDYADSFKALRDGQAFDDETLKSWYEGRYINVQPLDQTTGPDNAMRARNGGYGGRCFTQWVRRSI